jgi:branched-subunit amino acid transport protein
VSPLVLAALALITYVSRAVPVVLLPRPSLHIETILSRIPAPIFASLATATLLGDGGALVSGPTLAAAAGALLLSPARSLLPCLIGGAVGYAAAAWLG